MTRAAVCFGGPSPEHDISILTGLQAVHALAASQRDPIALYWSPAGTWHLVEPDLEAPAFADGLPRSAIEVNFSARPGGGFVQARGRRRPLPTDVVINCCHGGPGEDGGLSALLEAAGIPYTGPDRRSAAICMDKLAFSGAAAAAGLPTLPLWLLADGPPGPGLSDAAAADLSSGPLIVKPRFGGSSIGIEIVADLDTARALARTSPLLAEGAVVQRYLGDTADLNISVRTWPQLRLSAIEKPVRSQSAIYSYAEKYLTGDGGLVTAPRELPAVLPGPVTEALHAAARDASRLAMVRSVVRIDFLWDGGEDPAGLWVNEINPIPGSLSWYFWSDEGESLIDLLDDLVAEALERAGSAHAPGTRTHGADGTALRSAGAIAAKLS